MELKKLLSMGVLSLAIVCAMPVATNAQELTKADKAAVTGVYNEFKDQKIVKFVNTDSKYFDKVMNKVPDSAKDKADSFFKSDSNTTIKQAVKAGINYCDACSNKEEKFTEYKAKITKKMDVVISRIDAFNDKTGDDRSKAEDKGIGAFENAVKGYTLKAGKNANGDTTALIKDENGKVVAQATIADVKKVQETFNNLNSYEEFKNYAAELGIK